MTLKHYNTLMGIVVGMFALMLVVLFTLKHYFPNWFI